MLTTSEVGEILNQLYAENTSSSNNDLFEAVECIVYRNDIFEYGAATQGYRHIDIEFSFGDYYEIAETTALFQFVCSLCDFPQSEREWILYQQEF